MIILLVDRYLIDKKLALNNAGFARKYMIRLKDPVALIGCRIEMAFVTGVSTLLVIKIFFHKFNVMEIL